MNPCCIETQNLKQIWVLPNLYSELTDSATVTNLGLCSSLCFSWLSRPVSAKPTRCLTSMGASHDPCSTPHGRWGGPWGQIGRDQLQTVHRIFRGQKLERVLMSISTVFKKHHISNTFFNHFFTSQEAVTLSPCIVNILTSDALVILGARASVAMIVNWFSWNILVSAPEAISWWANIDGLVQERRNSIANALELRLSYTNSLISCLCIGSRCHWPIHPYQATYYNSSQNRSYRHVNWALDLLSLTHGGSLYW